MRFALNHITAPAMPVAEFFAMATRLGIREVEIRNDLPDVVGRIAARDLHAMAEDRGIAILSINALYPFNLWSPELGERAARLADYAAEAGIGALVMCPLNEDRAVSHSQNVEALDNLRPILAARGIRGLVEPLGFPRSSLRRKDEAIAAITEAGGFDAFALLHDTFHHHLSDEAVLYPHRTGLVHISGVIDPDLPLAKIEDEHRQLLDGRDILGNIDQIRALLADGYDGPFSFEPFSPLTHAIPNIEAALRASMGYVQRALARDAS